jgi:hypothetical protein
MIAASSEAVRPTRRPVNANGVPIHTTTFIGSNWMVRGPDTPLPERGAIYPMAFLVEQPPGSVVQAHFHQADQFQVVVAGGGTLGRHAVGPVTVHYTNAHTAYGPIAAGEDGLQYFTLRNSYDPGARYVPESTPELRAVPGRRPWQTTTEPAARADVVPARVEEMLAPRADGLGTWRYFLPAGERLSGPAPASGRGQFWLVVAGGLLGPEGLLPPLSLIFVAPEEAPLSLVAAEAGAEVLAMQYPIRAH